MIFEVIVVSCMIIWALADFHKKRWTPNERLMASMLLLIVAALFILSDNDSTSDISLTLSVASLALALLVTYLEYRFNKSARR